MTDQLDQQRYVVRLDAEAADLTLASADGANLGGKGAALARLIDAGYRVPRTGMVTTDAYQMAAAHPCATTVVERVGNGRNPLRAERVDDAFAQVQLDVAAEEAILSLARWVGDGHPIAVRSSATVEDLDGSSFAGQYRSILDVDSADPDAVMDAVKAVWASLWHPAPVAYRDAFGFADLEVAMAVVLMQMVPATTAGVVFTLDPGGEQDCCRVEAVQGLGESLVSGARTPSAWVVPRTGARSLPNAVEQAVTASLDVEARFGVPQDIEWAAVGDRVYLVQARPITVLDSDDGFDSPIDDHELTTAGIAEMVPGVLGPLAWELNHYLLGEAFRSFLDNLGVLQGDAADDRPFVRRVRGRVAIDFDQLRDAAADVPGAIEQLEHEYFGDAEGIAESETEPGANPQTRGSGRHGRMASWWRGAWRDVLSLRTRGRVVEQADVVVRASELLRHRPVDLEVLTDRQLFAYMQRVIDLAARGLAAELGVAAVAASSYDRLVNRLNGHLGTEEGSRAAQLLTTGATTTIERDPAASAAIFGGSTWVELGTRPVPPTESDHVDAAAMVTSLEIEQRLKDLPGWRLRRAMTGQIIDVRIHLLRRDIRDARDQTWRREAAKAAVLRLGGESRRVHRQIGVRLVARGLLANPNDVDLLSTGEIVSAARGTPTHRSDTIRRRRNWISRYEAEGPLPLRFRGIPDRTPEPLPDGDVLSGWASSPGRYRGRARTITAADDSLEPGEILVAATTDASWSPLFMKAGAVVVERGGPLSHAAILSRELGLPAVLNVANATRVLDGRVVTVDGDHGSVVIELDEAQKAPQ